MYLNNPVADYIVRMIRLKLLAMDHYSNGTPPAYIEENLTPELLDLYALYPEAVDYIRRSRNGSAKLRDNLIYWLGYAWADTAGFVWDAIYPDGPSMSLGQTRPPPPEPPRPPEPTRPPPDVTERVEREIEESTGERTSPLRVQQIPWDPEVRAAWDALMSEDLRYVVDEAAVERQRSAERSERWQRRRKAFLSWAKDHWVWLVAFGLAAPIVLPILITTWKLGWRRTVAAVTGEEVCPAGTTPLGSGLGLVVGTVGGWLFARAIAEEF